MDSATNADLKRIRTGLLNTMQGFMQPFENDGSNAPYCAADIGRCAAILDALVAKLDSAAGNAGCIMSAVQDAVLKLNELSKEVERLIETGQREDLCEFIELAAAAAGLEIEAGKDITEEWREW